MGDKMYKLFSQQISHDGITFKHTRGASDRSGKEFHIYHEIILFLGGDAEFISEHIHMKPTHSTLIVIPKETYHQMIIHNTPARYHRCVLQFHDIPQLSRLISESMSALTIIEADSNIRYLFDKLIGYTASQHSQPPLLSAVLTLLLSEITARDPLILTENPQNPLVRRAVDYINQHIGRRLTVDEIAACCSVSPSTLSHIFKREMNIPLHRFIIKKRLINAYHRISAGEPATTAAMECGFNDYSGFYKQYKKTFGFPPSQRTR